MKSRTTKDRILIVDDMPTNIKVLGETLRVDYDIIFARSGQKALEIIQETPPDLILLDIMMPGVDGFEVCKKLQENAKTKDIPVIFITARGEEEDETRGFELGAVDYITKPFNPAVVKVRVHNHLELKHHRDNLEELVKERTNQLIHSERLATVGTISAAVAHEIMNPLFYISLFAELLQQDLEGKAISGVDEKLEKIISGTRKISGLIDSLRGYSRKDDTTKNNYELSEILNSMLDIMGYQLDRAGITVDTAGISEGLKIYCNYQKISQVFVNLVNNAADALEGRKGNITITAGLQDDLIVIQVKDDGPGMPEDVAAKIFDPFFTTKDRDKGTGLGLFIVRNIIEDHNGDIHASSSDGYGTVFKITLPR